MMRRTSSVRGHTAPRSLVRRAVCAVWVWPIQQLLPTVDVQYLFTRGLLPKGHWRPFQVLSKK